MRRLAAMLIGAAFLGLAGCHVTVREVPPPPPPTTTYVVEEHVHGDGCCHVWSEQGGWVWCQRGHIHRPGCGHYWDGGRWCLVRPRTEIIIQAR